MPTEIMYGAIVLCFIINAVFFTVVVCEGLKRLARRYRYQYKFCMRLHKFFKENDDQLEFDFEMPQK